MAKLLASGIGIAGGALVIIVQPTTLEPVMVIVGVLLCLPLLLIITLALVAVYSTIKVRRGAAEKILDLLLSALTRPRQQ
jgi:hypothetical protein